MSRFRDRVTHSRTKSCIEWLSQNEESFKTEIYRYSEIIQQMIFLSNGITFVSAHFQKSINIIGSFEVRSEGSYTVLLRLANRRPSHFQTLFQIFETSTVYSTPEPPHVHRLPRMCWSPSRVCVSCTRSGCCCCCCWAGHCSGHCW